MKRKTAGVLGWNLKQRIKDLKYNWVVFDKDIRCNCQRHWICLQRIWDSIQLERIKFLIDITEKLKILITIPQCLMANTRFN